MNSSIAAGAGETAAIDAALPIAQADAGIAAGERGWRAQEYQQQRAQEFAGGQAALDREANRLHKKLIGVEVQLHAVRKARQAQRNFANSTSRRGAGIVKRH